MAWHWKPAIMMNQEINRSCTKYVYLNLTISNKTRKSILKIGKLWVKQVHFLPNWLWNMYRVIFYFISCPVTKSTNVTSKIMPCACSLKLLDEEVIVLNYRSNYVVTSTNIMLVSLTESIRLIYHSRNSLWQKYCP